MPRKGELNFPFVDGMGTFNIKSFVLGSGRNPDGVIK